MQKGEPQWLAAELCGLRASGERFFFLSLIKEGVSHLSGDMSILNYIWSSVVFDPGLPLIGN